MKRLALMIIYYGKKPQYLSTFLGSAANNKNIDFLIFSDWDNLPIYTSNIIHHNLPLNKFNEIAKNKKILKKGIIHPYKLCDLKPAWADILYEFIPESKYDYFGYIDIDLLLGNIMKILKLVDYKKFDCLNIGKEYLSGAFNILRNTHFYRTLYKKSVTWEFVFNDSRFFAFDEDFMPHFKDMIIENQIKLKSFHKVICEEENLGNLKTKWIDEFVKVERPIYLKYENGNIKDETNKEYLLFNYIRVKHSLFWIDPLFNKLPSVFFINKHGFYRYKWFPLTYFTIFFHPKQICHLLSHLWIKRIALSRYLNDLIVKKLIVAR